MPLTPEDPEISLINLCTYMGTNIYILSVVALDETNISGCLHFLMQNIEMSCDLDRASKPITFFVYRQLCDVIHVSPRRYVREFRAQTVPTPLLRMKYFIS